jgi:Tfp pilus assembly protein PilV
MRIKIPTKTRGEGLIETMVTFMLIGFGIMALIRFQNNLTYNDNVAQQQADATILAVNKIEALRDFWVLNTQAGMQAYQDIVTGTGTSTGINTTYTLTWTVTTFTNPNYKTIDVSVTWTDRYNASKTIRLISRVAGTDPLNSAWIMG